MKKIAVSFFLAIALLALAGCATDSTCARGRVSENDLASAGYIKKAPMDGENTVLTFSTNSLPIQINLDPINPAPIRLSNVPHYATLIRFWWDEEHFYANFYGNAYFVEAFDKEKYGAHDSLIYESDCYELFIDPVGDGKRYIELQVSPYGVKADYLHTFSEAPTYPADKIDRAFWSKHHVGSREWNAEGFEAKTTIEYYNDAVAGWSCEMSVLWNDITGDKNHMPKVGDRVYVNALRYVWFDHEGRRILAPLMTGPTLHGCPHMTPMAMRSVVLTN